METGHHTIIQIQKEIAVSMVFEHHKATTNLNTETILHVAKVDFEEAIRILAQDKKASFKVYCETLKKTRDEWDSKLYHKLIKGFTKFGLRKPIVDHFVQGNIMKKGPEFDVALTLLWRHALENSYSMITHHKLYIHHQVP